MPGLPLEPIPQDGFERRDGVRRFVERTATTTWAAALQGNG